MVKEAEIKEKEGWNREGERRRTLQKYYFVQPDNNFKGKNFAKKSKLKIKNALFSTFDNFHCMT